MRKKSSTPGAAIAVIGMGCWYPGAHTLRELWENILSRRRQFRRMPDQRLPLADYYDPDPAAPDKTYGTRAAVIDGFEFDWMKRHVPKLTYETADIAHWLALEVAVKALEDAGYTRESIPNERAGVILGNTLTGEQTRASTLRQRWPFVRRALRAAAEARGLADIVPELERTMEAYYKSVFAPSTEDSLSGGLSNTIAGRICNFLNFHGGGYTVDGACSSSLIAVATAATALTNHDLDFALAGGVDISLDTFELIGFAKTGALTQGDMTVYDRRASGFTPGEGCGFVALKRLEDAYADGNFVYAVLRGWGISSDGKGGLTAPGKEGQATALRRAYARAGYSPKENAFFEGHGTGTPVGDRAELEGIMLAAGDDHNTALRAQAVTSFKSLVGHTKAAAGVGGFIKAVMAVNRCVIPPTAGCKEPNPVFAEEAHYLYPALQGEVCDPAVTMRAGVSAMGFGGINCHVTLESGDAPAQQLEPTLSERALLVSNQESELFVLGAATIPALIERVSAVRVLAQGISLAELVDLAAHLAKAPEIGAGLRVRAAVIAGSPEELLEQLDALATLLRDTPPAPGQSTANPQNTIWVGNVVNQTRVGFLFPGQGSQQLNMTRVLVERFGWARDFVSAVDGWLVEMGLESISQYIYKPLDRALNPEQTDEWAKTLGRTEIAQPAICLASLLWLRYLADLGIKPVALGGHSLGELTAFFAAGAFDERALIDLAALRGQAMAAPAADAGTMASLGCAQDIAAELVQAAPGYVVVANINSPKQTVISGERASVEAVIELAKARDIQARPLSVSNAFHSQFVAAAAGVLRRGAPVPENLGQIEGALFSSVDGKPVKPGLNLREHFANQILSQVDFVALARAMARGCDLLIEVGPGRVLSGLVRDTLKPNLCLPVAAKAEADLSVVLAKYFVQGGAIHWAALYENRMVRPFVPVTERIFIENQCERPFNVTTPAAPIALASGGMVEAALAGSANISAPALHEYLARRGSFLAQVIRADLESSPAATAQPIRPVEMQPEAPPEALASLSVEARLVALVAKRTGYPADSISLEARLLDDLNLDSIKAGDLVAAAAKVSGAAGKIDPARFANASLRDIGAAIRAVVPETAAVRPPAPKSIEMQLVELVAERTGYPPESITPDARLLDDLNLDSIKAGDLVAAAAKASGAAGKIDPARFANASLKDIAAALQQFSLEVAAQAAAPAPVPAVPDVEERATWVRNFAVEYVIEELPPASGAHWGSANVLIVHEADQARLAPALRGALLSHGAGKVQMASFAETRAKNLINSASHVIAILSPNAPDLRHVVEQLQTLAAPGENQSALAFVQFGEMSDQFGAAAFAASLHLERPDLKVRLIEVPGSADPGLLAERIIDELSTSEAYAQASYDTEFTRRTPRQRLQEPVTYARRDMTWTPEDVFLVTGGAKGITAECALALTGATGVRMALVGSSPNQPGSEIAQTLERFGSAGLTCAYYQCDVGDPEAVRALVARIQRDLGPITGVIHGAALNKPRRVEQATLESALEEVTPKVAGALNLCAALQDAPPRLFVGFSSIIGVTGMPGSAWYGFSNEALNRILESFHAAHPATAIISMAFSVWGEVGMGARLGSAHVLARLGIAAIPTEEGVRRFLQLVQCDPGVPQVIVAARLGGLDTWRPFANPLPTASRYLEQPINVEPGVEVIVRAHLDLERDAYVKDHVYKDSPLFPTVFGLEAMAQAVALVTGRQTFEHLRIEDIRLERPIVVDPVKGVTIEIHAAVLERETADSALRVQVEIGTEQTGFNRAHFAAVFVLNPDSAAQMESIDLPVQPLDIDPAQDLYSWLLFQGPLFQRLRLVHRLDSSQAVFRSEVRAEPFILGDPYFRDSLLQSAQLNVSQEMCLPVHIDSLELADFTVSAPTLRDAAATFESRDEHQIVERIVAIDEAGNVVERLNGYRLQILERLPDNPRPEQIANPAAFDAERLRETLRHQAEAFRASAPEIALAYLPGLHDLNRAERHAAELPLFAEAIRRVPGLEKSQPVIEWLADGRPVVQGKPVHISLSHDDRVCLCVAGPGAQGCDITPVRSESREDWIALLGQERAPLLDQLAAPYAGTRIWAAVEALRKATGGAEIDLAFEDRNESGAIRFRGGTPEHRLHVLTFPIRLLRGPERVVALVIAPAPVSAEPLPDDGFNRAVYALTLSQDGPQHQRVFALRFPLTFRETANLSRSLYFSHYFTWMGQLREAALQPVYGALADQFTTGQWGMVTNRAETRIVGTATAKDVIEGRFWLEKVYGPANSTMDLCYEWQRLLPGGGCESIAFSKMTATWVAILDHGLVEAKPFPAYFQEYVNRMAPPNGAHSTWKMPGTADLGDEIHRSVSSPNNMAVLHEQQFETSLEEANLVGNIYFANYYIWQGRTVDHFFYAAAPEYFRDGTQGEFRCVYSKVEHLREAMPFERIAVKMALGALHERGVQLLLEYFRVMPDDQYVKLAFGEFQAVWMAPSPDGAWRPAPPPAVFKDALLVKAGQA